MGILEVFGYFLKKFLIQDHETWFTGILWVLSGVCEKWPLWAKFSAVFDPKYSQNSSIYIQGVQRSEKSQGNSRLGKSQGILLKVREKNEYWEKSGNLHLVQSK